MDKKILGYARVSSYEQNEDRQVAALLEIIVIDMPILDTTRDKKLLGTFLNDIVLALFSYVAENERMNIRQRQAEGIAAAKAKDVKFGRPPVPLPDNFHEVYSQWKRKALTLKQGAQACNLPQGTFYDKVRGMRKCDVSVVYRV